MKKLAIIIAVMLIQTQLVSIAANENFKKQPSQQVKKQTTQQAQNTKPVTQTKQQAQPQKDDEYLLKYNIRDLEAAPWLHGGKRSYN